MKPMKLYMLFNVTYRKIWYTIICVIFFSLVYLSCKNKEFAGWLNSEGAHYTENDKKKYVLFKKYGHDKKTIVRDEFSNMPIFKIDNKYVFENLVGKNFNPLEVMRMRSDIYDAFTKDNDMDFKIFREIPINIDQFNIDVPSDLEIPFDGTLNLGSAVTDYFDRLYFSVVTQTTLGYGDIFPASRKVRVITMFQALSTLAIFIL